MACFLINKNDLNKNFELGVEKLWILMGISRQKYLIFKWKLLKLFGTLNNLSNV